MRMFQVKEELQFNDHHSQHGMVDSSPVAGEVVIIQNHHRTTTTTTTTNNLHPGSGPEMSAVLDSSQWQDTTTNGVKLEGTLPPQHDEDTLGSPMMIKSSASPPDSSSNLMCDDGNMYYGRLTYRDHSLLIHELCIDIGRNSSRSTVDFHVSKNNFISRKHMQIRFHPDTDSFHLNCFSKNGIFVDGMFQRSNMEPLELPKK